MTNDDNRAYAATILRVSIGAMFIAHGLLKVLVFTIPGTVGYFQQIGFPGFLAYPVIAYEIIGGAALIAGIYTRYVALAGIPVLIGALLVHAGNGMIFSNANGGWEFPAFWTIALIVLALLGDGAYSLKQALRGER